MVATNFSDSFLLPDCNARRGGCFQVNAWESEPDYELSKRILQNNFKLYPDLAPPGAKSWEDSESALIL